MQGESTNAAYLKKRPALSAKFEDMGGIGHIEVMFWVFFPLLWNAEVNNNDKFLEEEELRTMFTE